MSTAGPNSLYQKFKTSTNAGITYFLFEQHFPKKKIFVGKWNDSMKNLKKASGVEEY